MIKIEYLSPDCVAYISRNTASNSTVSIYPTMLLSHKEFETLIVKQGAVTYSVDELEVKTKYAEPISDSSKDSIIRTIHNNLNSNESNNRSVDTDNSVTSSTNSSDTSDSDDPVPTDVPVKITTKKAGKTVGRTVKAK